MKSAALHWSGGKDAAYCLHRLGASGQIRINKLITSITEPYNRISMHGVRVELLEKQVESLGLPLERIFLSEIPSMDDYESAMKKKLISLQKEGIEVSVFGDIFLQDIRSYRERLLSEISIECLFPLWQLSTQELSKELINAGFKAIVVCIDDKFLDEHFVGQDYDFDFLNNLPKNVDPCGENGEFHTFVYDGPGFCKPISFDIGKKIYREYEVASKEKAVSGFWFCDLIPK